MELGLGLRQGGGAVSPTPALSEDSPLVCRREPPATPREEELLVELEEKERQLAIAAEIGQSLVHKAEDLQRRHDMLAESAARTSSGMDESDYRIREVTSQNERLLELLAQSEADLAEVQKQSASEPAASPAGEGNEGFDESDQPSVRKQQQVIVVMRSEITALQQRVAELNKDNEELLEAKLMEEEGRIQAERTVRELQDKLARANAQNATMADEMVRKELELRKDTDAARAQAAEAIKQNEQLRVELSVAQSRLVTAQRHATGVANAAPRPFPPSLSGAKSPSQARVVSGPDGHDQPTRQGTSGHDQPVGHVAHTGAESPQSEQMTQDSAVETSPGLEFEESLGGGAGSLLDEFIAEADAYRVEAEEAQAEVATLRKKLESLRNQSPRKDGSPTRTHSGSQSVSGLHQQEQVAVEATAFSDNGDDGQEKRIQKEQEAEAFLRAQLKEAEEAMQTCIQSAQLASQRANAERKRMRLAAELAQDTEKALKLRENDLRERLERVDATAAARLQAAAAKERKAMEIEEAERSRRLERQTQRRESEAEKSERASLNADRAQARMRRRLAEVRADEQSAERRRTERDTRRRRLDNAITLPAVDKDLLKVHRKGVEVYAERLLQDVELLADSPGHLSPGRTSPTQLGELSSPTVVLAQVRRSGSSGSVSRSPRERQGHSPTVSSSDHSLSFGRGDVMRRSGSGGSVSRSPSPRTRQGHSPVVSSSDQSLSFGHSDLMEL